MLNKLISSILILSVFYQVALCNPVADPDPQPDPGLGKEVRDKVIGEVLDSEEFKSLLSDCGKFIMNNTKDAINYLKEHKDEIIEKAKKYGTEFADNVKTLFNNSFNEVSEKVKEWKNKAKKVATGASGWIAETANKTVIWAKGAWQSVKDFFG